MRLVRYAAQRDLVVQSLSAYEISLTLSAGIGRTFTYGGARNRPMYDPEHPPIEVGGSFGQHSLCSQLHGGWLSLALRYVL